MSFGAANGPPSVVFCVDAFEFLISFSFVVCFHSEWICLLPTVGHQAINFPSAAVVIRVLFCLSILGHSLVFLEFIPSHVNQRCIVSALVSSSGLTRMFAFLSQKVSE